MRTTRLVLSRRSPCRARLPSGSEQHHRVGPQQVDFPGRRRAGFGVGHGQDQARVHGRYRQAAGPAEDPTPLPRSPCSISQVPDLERSSHASDLDVESLRFCQPPHCSDPSGNAHARVDAYGAMPMLAWTFAPATAGNAHARMEPGGDPCLENAHARVEGAGSDAAHEERPWHRAMPMLVSILTSQLFGGLGANLTLPTEGRTAPTPRRRKFREPRR